MALPTPSSPRPDPQRTLVIVAALAAVLALPVGMAVGMAWVELPWSQAESRATPEWLALPVVRATTSDGLAVKTRVAVDAEDAGTRRAIQRKAQQVGLLLETSVALHTQRDLAGAPGIDRLGRGMQASLNGWLAAEGVPPVRQVVVQDLLVNAP